MIYMDYAKYPIKQQWIIFYLNIHLEVILILSFSAILYLAQMVFQYGSKEITTQVGLFQNSN